MFRQRRGAIRVTDPEREFREYLLRIGGAGLWLPTKHGIRDVLGLKRSITWARAGVKTYLTKNGFVNDLVSNQHDPMGWVHPAFTNLVLRNMELDNAAWGKTFTTISADAGTFAGQTFDRILETADTDNHAVGATATVAVTSSANILYMVHVKPNGRDWIQLRLFNGAGSSGVTKFFDITNGALGDTGTSGTGSFTDANMVPLADGGYLCWMVGKIGAFTACAHSMYISTDGSTISYAGDVTKGVDAFGFQLVNNVATLLPLVKTEGAGVAQVADQPATSAVFGAPSNTMGTYMVCWYQPATIANLPTAAATLMGHFINLTGGNDRINLWRSGSTWQWLVQGNSSTAYSNTFTDPGVGVHVATCAYGPTDADLVLNQSYINKTGTLSFAGNDSNKILYVGNNLTAGRQSGCRILGVAYIPNYKMPLNEIWRMQPLFKKVAV